MTLRARTRRSAAVVSACAALSLGPFALAQPVASGDDKTEIGPSGLPAELYDPDGASSPTPAEPQTDAASAAPDAARLEKAERVLALALPKTRLAEMLGAIRPEIEKQLRDEAARRGENLTPDLAKQLVSAQEEELNALYAAMFPKLPPIYAATFSEAELDRLLALYGSDEGRSLMAKLDGLSLQLAATMRPYIAIYRNRLKERVRTTLEAAD